MAAALLFAMLQTQQVQKAVKIKGVDVFLNVAGKSIWSKGKRIKNVIIYK